jgi:hypothetical protein
MDMTIREDLKPLAVFYPDPDQRYQMHYLFAHRFLPEYVHSNPYAFFMYLYSQDIEGGPMDPTRFIQSRWDMFENRIGLAPTPGDRMPEQLFRRVEDLTMTTAKLHSRAGALVRMPNPEHPTEAFFVGIVLEGLADDVRKWPRDVQARVFTLEAEINREAQSEPTGVVCEWSRDETHLNHGIMVSASSEAFRAAISELIVKPQLKP